MSAGKYPFKPLFVLKKTEVIPCEKLLEIFTTLFCNLTGYTILEETEGFGDFRTNHSIPCK